MEFLKRVSEHTNSTGSFSLEFNPHKLYFETAKSYIDEHELHDDFETDAERGKAIFENSLVVFQWYEHTPVGFLHFCASNLEALGKYVEAYIDSM